jgi:hypothetical protein
MPEPISTGAAILGASALGTGASLYGASQASKAQKSAANRAADEQRAMFERQVELQEPFRQAGLTAQNRLLTLMGLGEDKTVPDYGKYARDFTMADYTADPGYGFRMSEGMKALERSAAARGGLLSGATLKGTQRFGQDLASQEYMNAFNRYQTNRSNQLNPLQSLMGAGQTSTNVLTGAAGQTGQGVGNAMLAGGAARASGYTGMASALNQGLSTGANMYLQKPLYDYLGRLNAAPGAGLSPYPTMGTAATGYENMYGAVSN